MCRGKGIAGSSTSERGNSGRSSVLMLSLSVHSQITRLRTGDILVIGSVILKLKRTPALYLVGFMASGKTTIGRAVADELGWPFTDIDSEIESCQGKSIAEIFLNEGETVFRDLETEAIRTRVMAIEAGNPCVVALGGGAFVQPRNWELIQNNGIAVWLDCRLETVRK